MKHIKIFEEFQEGPMDKPQGLLSRIAQGAKHAMGFENEMDRKNLESLHRALTASSKYDWVKGIREIKPGVIVASVNDNSVTADMVAPEIIYKGKQLDLHNLKDEVKLLYDRLMKIQRDA
jgi:hypothetical protein